MEEKNGRQKTSGKEKSKHMAMDYWWSNSVVCNSTIDNGGKLNWKVTFALLLFIAYFSDTTLSSIGLMKGVWQHYNPIGVWIYHQLTIFGFVIYRVILFYVIYRIISAKIIEKAVKILLPSAVYIYICAILWDLHSLDYIDIYVIVPWPILKLHSHILNVLFSLFGVI